MKGTPSILAYQGLSSFHFERTIVLKQTVQYTDFDGNQAMETLYFNLTRTEVAENLHLRDKFQDLENRLDLESGSRTLNPNEIAEVLDLVKILMKLAYGIRSDDGKRFIKNDQIWEEFTQTAVYDAFLFSLFEDADKANEFMMGVFPRELADELARQTETGTDAQTTPDISSVPENADGRPAWMVEGRDPTQQEFAQMSKAEMQKAFEYQMERRAQHD